ncbi:N-acetylmuramoyl-L-alanine amidase [Nocardioides salsibiostraticola]
MPTEGTPRRPLLKAFAAGSVALGGIAVAARVTDSSDPDRPRPALSLSGDSSSAVSSLDVRLGDDLLPGSGQGQWRSAQLPTSTHSMVALTWRAGAPEPVIEIKSRASGAWGPWTRLSTLHDAPDAASGEGGTTVGTDLVWIGKSDGIQIRLDGARPPDLTLVLLNPGRLDTDLNAEAATPSEPDGASYRSARIVAPTPAILTRRDWGADEKMRDPGPRYNSTLKQVHVHHTVSSNDYSRNDVAGLIRGMYRYHVQNLGWSDIGYNFLVDRFGRVWTGRAGGVERLVRGAHTLGFNDTSTGISAIGNFEVTRPTAAMREAIAQVAAWKLSTYGIEPVGKTTVTSEGSDKYSRGRRATLPAIDGHRDTNDTACPGIFLYNALPGIRRRASAIVKEAGTPAPKTVTVDLRTVGYTGRAVVKANLVSPDGSPARGKVTVKLGSRRRVKRLKNGRVRVGFLRVRPGSHRVTVTHRANKVVTRKKGTVRTR